MPDSNLRRYAPQLIVAAAIAFVFRDLFLGRVFAFEDIAAYFQPLWTAASRAMRHGVLPSWDLGAWSGQPLTGDPQIGLFYPPNWIWMIFRPVVAYSWLQLAHSAWAATGMAMLARARGRSREAATLAGCAFGLSAFMVLETRHAMFTATTAWMPWVLWGVERYTSTRRLEHLVATAGSFGMAVLAGGWSMLYYGMCALGVYAFARAFSSPNRPRVAASLTSAFAIGLGLAAVQLVPAFFHARLSPRALGLTYEEASSYAWPSFSYAITLLFPTWLGSWAQSSYSGAPDQWELAGYSIGALATLLALPSLLRRDRRGERIAMGFLCVAAILLARGAGTPLHRLLYDHLPGFAGLRCPARALYLWTLILPILAADGLDFLLERTSRKTLFGTLAVLAVALELAITWRAELPSVTRAEAEARPPALEWIRRHGRSGRMTNDVHLPQPYHNAGLRFGLESAGGYSSLPLWRTLHFMWIANHGAVFPYDKIHKDLTAQGLWRLGSPLVDLLSIKWMVASRAHPPDGSGWTLAFEGDDGVDVWKNAETFPRGFVVYRAIVAPDDDAQARALADPSFRPDRVAIVDRPLVGVPAPDGKEPHPMMTPIHALVREGAHDLAVEVFTRAPGVLVLPEPWHPGWKVMVDGMPAELLRVDYALRGVRLEAGTHAVAMAFEDAPLAYGSALTLTALALIVGLAYLGRRRQT